MADVTAQLCRVIGMPRLAEGVRLIAGVVLLTIGIAGAISLVHFARTAAEQDTYGFSGTYTAARLAVLGEAKGSLQDLAWFELQTRRYGFKATDVFFGNPPSAALVMTPVAFLPPKKARVVWIWMSLAFWIIGIGLLGLTSVKLTRSSVLVIAPALLCLAVVFGPAKANIEEGQVYTFAFLLQSICCWLWLRNRPLAAGTLAGMLLASKGYGLPVIILAFFRRDWRFLIGAASSFMILAIISVALLGFRQWPDFVVTHAHSQFSGIPTPALQTLKSFLILALRLPTVPSGPLRVVTPSADFVLTCFQGLLFLGLLLWLSQIRLTEILSRKPLPPPSAFVLSACVLINLVFSPRAEEHAYPLAMTAVLLVIPSLRKLEGVSASVIFGAVLLAWPFHLQDRSGTNGWDLIGDFARLWGAIILLVASFAAEYVSRVRARRNQEPQTSIASASGTNTWGGAYAACVLGIALTLWYVKPWRNPVSHGPLLAVSRTDVDKITLIRLDLEEREVATIPVAECKGPFGLTFARRDWLYSACWNNSKVSLIDLPQLRQTTPFAAAKLPAWASFRDGADEVWISNEAASKVTIYRAGTSTLLGEIPTGQGPSDIVFSNGGKQAWVSNEVGNGPAIKDVSRAGAGSVSLLDAVRRQKVRDIPVGSVPQGMTLSSRGDRLLVTNFKSDTVSVVDTASARELLQIPVCHGPVDIATSNHRGVELAFVSCYTSGLIGVVELNRQREIQRIPVGDKPFGIAAYPDRGRVYVCVGGSNRLVVLEAGTPSRILRRMRLNGTPLQIALAR